MIERKFVREKLKEHLIEEYIGQAVQKVGHSHTKVSRTPLGEKVIIYSSRPGLIVGKKGANIKKITNTLKKRFELENPQVEIAEVENIFLDPRIVAEMIASTLERFGSSKFKGIGHKMMSDARAAGARGIEILISGKIPSARAKRWRFYQGYLKKSGEVAKNQILTAYSTAELKTGTVGIQVRIMPPDIKMPDEIIIKPVEDVQAAAVVEIQPEPEKKKKAPRKKTATKKKQKKKAAETEEPKEE